MINQELKLNTKIWNEDNDRGSTRQGFGEGLLQAGIENENVVALCADLSESTKVELFKEKFPERYVEMGVAEQNMASVASGMASMGKVPFISSFAIFSPGLVGSKVLQYEPFNVFANNIEIIDFPLPGSPCNNTTVLLYLLK
jgi:transketolase